MRKLFKVVVVFFVLSWATSAIAATNIERERWFSGNCLNVMDTGDLPTAVKSEFARLTHKDSFAMADPGKSYQATDVIIRRNLPRRRLIFAVHCDDRWIIHYERGGIGHYDAVVVFYGTDAPRLLWAGVGFKQAKDLQELRRMINSDMFKDDSRNYY